MLNLCTKACTASRVDLLDMHRCMISNEYQF